MRMTAKQATLPEIPERPRGDRGCIGEYSPGSRVRLRAAVWSVEPALLPRKQASGRWLKPGSFVTLTYPRNYEQDAHACKAHLRAWWKRVTHRWPDAWMLWALERQKRGAWHFHLLTHWPPPGRSETWRSRRLWVSQSWAEVVAGAGRPVDPDHVAAGTRVDALVTAKKLALYVSKPGSKKPHLAAVIAAEIAKRGPQKAGSAQGRWWGILGGPAYQRSARVVALHLPPATAARLAEALRQEWEAFAESRGFEWEWQPPQWADGRRMDAVLSRSRLDVADLFAESEQSFDPRTGELYEIDLGRAAAA